MAAASTPHASTQAHVRTEAQTGWIVFAGLLLLVGGGFNICYGLAALLNDEVIRVGGQGVIVLDFTVWGWVHLITGTLMLLTCWGLLTMRGWARWAGITFAMINALVQVAAITAFPIAALLMVTIDLIIMYQLTVHWEEV